MWNSVFAARAATKIKSLPRGNALDQNMTFPIGEAGLVMAGYGAVASRAVLILSSLGKRPSMYSFPWASALV